MVMLHVIVPVYDAGDAFVNCLASLTEQHSVECTVTIIDDASTDTRNYELADKMAPTEVIGRWNVSRNRHNLGALRNIWNGIATADPAPDDVIVLLDGDDWLAYPDSLAKIAAAYDDDPDCWLTYGSYVSHPHDPTCPVPVPYPRDVVRDRSFRQHDTLFNHPLTFKAFLWQQLEPADCQFDDGTWMREVYDEAIMYPLLELCGPNHRCLTDTLYVYNSENPLSVAKVKREAAEAEALALRSRPPKPRMFLSDGALTLSEDDRAALVVEHCHHHDLTYVVETGTGAGWTADRVARSEHVERVVTIDNDLGVYQAAIAQFADRPKVQPILGDSPDVIRTLLPTLPPAVWWLDAHRDRWWEGDPATVTPILDELFLILSRGQPDVVLIDDARLFGRAPGYPELDNVRGHVERIGEPLGLAWSFTVAADVVRIIPVEVTE